MQFDATGLVVLQHLDRQRQPGRIAGPGLRAAELPARAEAVERLALLQRYEPRELFGMFADFGGDGQRRLFQIRIRFLRPIDKGTLG